MGRLTVSCPMAALGPEIVNMKNVYEVIYKEITKTMDEKDIYGIQLYPSGWPRKLQTTVRDDEVKERIVIQGIEMFGKHIDMRDDVPHMKHASAVRPPGIGDACAFKAPVLCMSRASASKQ